MEKCDHIIDADKVRSIHAHKNKKGKPGLLLYINIPGLPTTRYNHNEIKILSTAYGSLQPPQYPK